MLSFNDFSKRVLTHKNAVKERFGDYFVLRERGNIHPVLDFLYTYYHFRPGQLERYSAGYNIKIELPTSVTLIQDIPNSSLMKINNDRLQFDLSQFPIHRANGLDYVINLLEQTQESEPQFGCLGMHEWAMVYKNEENPRYTEGFRLKPSEIQEFVESRPIRCSHYDAFRFFTPEAKPLNKLQPDKNLMPEMEQSGCIHTNMDVYRWAYKFYPWVNSDLILKAFDVAYTARFIDMKASPYDLSSLGINPIYIETKVGAEEYISEQKRLHEMSLPVREELICVLNDLREALKVKAHIEV